MEEHQCTEKENIKKLFDFHDTKLKQLHEMEVRQVEIQGDVKHIKARLDNGMSHTIANLNTLFTKLEPIIEHHAFVIKKIEGIGWWISMGFIVACAGTVAWALSKGLTL